jgi:hypothetical protein
MTFIRKHWLGQYSLSFSFWFIFIFFSLIFHAFSSFCLQQFSSSYATQVSTLFLYQLTAGLLILPWQIIGLLRSAEHYFKNYGQPIILHSVQVTVVIGLTAIMIHFLGQIQLLMFEKNWNDLQSNALPKQYNIQWHENNKQIMLNGTLDFGVTDAVRDFLLIHPNAEGIIIESKGGQVYEGRGLATLFSHYKLDTYSFRYCLSACATAFIGGVKRYLGKDGKLGFHQYTFDSENIQNFRSFYNLEAEQDKDREVYRSKNITEHFIQKMFKSPNNGIWYPDREILLQSGVITATVIQ